MPTPVLVAPEHLLLGNRFAPITSEMGFIAAPRDQVVHAYLAWQTPLQAERKIKFDVTQVAGSCSSVLKRLVPLTQAEASKSLFLPLENGWTAYVDNLAGGTDAESIVLCVSQRLSCLGIKMLAAPNTMSSERSDAAGAYGGLTLHVYDPKQADDDLGYNRVIALINDAGRWVFVSEGSPLPFEDIQSYDRKVKTDRFSFSKLKTYLNAFGLSAFDERFYRTLDPGAILIEARGRDIDALESISLQEARRLLGIEG